MESLASIGATATISYQSPHQSSAKAHMYMIYWSQLETKTLILPLPIILHFILPIRPSPGHQTERRGRQDRACVTAQASSYTAIGILELDLCVGDLLLIPTLRLMDSLGIYSHLNISCK